jgi:hypothetical protein
MKDYLLNVARAVVIAAIIAAASVLGGGKADAQAVTQQPSYVDAGGVVTDFGNGPLRFQTITGSAMIFTSSFGQIGTSAGTTALTLAATAAANPPCVGCGISCVNGPLANNCSVPAGTIVTAFNGTTGITTSVATTVTAAQVNWGVACPTTASPASVKPAMIGGGMNLPFWTTARLCGAAAPGQPGASLAISAVNTVQ